MSDVTQEVETLETVVVDMSTTQTNGKKTKSNLVKPVVERAMTVTERERIEKLVDSRAKSLQDYLNEIRTFATEANDNLPFSEESTITELKTETSQLVLQLEKISSQKETEKKALQHILAQHHDTRIKRIEALLSRAKLKHKEELDIAFETVDKKFNKKESDLTKRQSEIEARLNELNLKAKAEKTVRKLALVNSFNHLRDGIHDQRNKAVEQLWTDCYTVDKAAGVLGLIPDTGTFRENVSPEKLFTIFNDTICQKALPLSKICCPKCGSSNVQDNGSASMCCSSCGHYFHLDKSVTEMVALPTIQEIVRQSSQFRIENQNGHG